MRLLLSILLVCIAAFLPAQTGNLVRNGGFESAAEPVISTWLKENPVGTKLTDGWLTPTLATPDYYNSDRSLCDGFPVAIARTGTGRGAFICGMENQLPGVKNYKEYLQGELTQPLIAGKEYAVSFYVTLDCSSPQTSTGIGAYFSSERIQQNSKEKLNVNPQIISYQKITWKDGWTLISGTFKAKGGEKYITLGSYSDTSVVRLTEPGTAAATFISSPHISNHVYFYIDDVCVSPADEKLCDCKQGASQQKSEGEYYFFVLDASNSMNESGKLDLMKQQIMKFADSIDSKNKIGIMIFNSTPSILLPFTGANEDKLIEKKINKIKAKGTTNGDLAVKRMYEYIDSLKLPARCHVIFATDGIFRISLKTKAEADSVLIRTHTSLCVLQFGTTKNEDLEDMANTVEDGLYTFANEGNLNSILQTQMPVVEVVEDKSRIVYYSEISSEIDPMLLQIMIMSNPGDQFMKIPRKGAN
ncbi:MAG: VWA domain-containing protein [Bacteroidia bacterium]|nr:VWA domain-containing protein [Bacteroidia bacterium]